MSTPVIQSSASTPYGAPSASCTITKPTGLAVGDLMLAILSTYEGTGNITIADKAGWTTIDSIGSSFVSMKAMYRIATSGDVAASNFVFSSSFGTPDNFGGIIHRITGHTAAGPIGDFETALGAGTTTTPSFSISVSPRRADALLIMGFNGDTGGASTTASGYTISGANPTWTEDLDITESTDNVFAVAHAAANSIVDITSMTLTLTQACSDNLGILISIPEQANVSVTPAAISISAVVNSPASTGFANVSAPLVGVTMTPVSPAASVPTPRWTPQTKSTPPTWTPQSKN